MGQYSKQKGFKFHESFSNAVNNETKYVCRGKVLCSKRTHESCPFVIHFAARLEEDASIPYPYEITKCNKEHSHELIPQVFESRMKDSLRDLNEAEWRLVT